MGCGVAKPVLGFRVLEHTADVGFEAFGETRAQVFRNAARALMNLIVDLDSVEPRDSLPLDATAGEPTGLVVNWLSEILYQQDAAGWLFHDFEVSSLDDRSMVASGRGERFDPARHRLKLLVKAITYHQLALERVPDGTWRAQVYVDI